MATGNVLEALGVWSQEDAITNLLTYSFKQSAEFWRLWLAALLDAPQPESELWQVVARPAVPGRGVPDMVFFRQGVGNAGVMLVVENKVKATEGDTQTRRYSSVQVRDALQKRFMPSAGPPPATTYVFLTLFGDEPEDKAFRPKSYSDLLPALKGFHDTSAPLAERLVRDWTEILDRVYRNADLSDDDVVLDRLKLDPDFDGGFVYFRSMLQRLRLPNGLKVELAIRSNDRGRPHYLACISKEAWHPRLMTDDPASLTPECHNIHIEPQYGLLTGRLSLFLHYETYSYQTEAWVKAHVPPSQHREWMRLREEFIKLLGEKSRAGLRLRNRWLQVGAADFDLKGKTLRQMRELIEPWLSMVAQAVDKVLGKMAF